MGERSRIPATRSGDVSRRRADYFLVGHALAKGDTIVTLEKGGATRRIKIPDACAALNVPCIGLFPLLKAAGVKFVLSP